MTASLEKSPSGITGDMLIVKSPADSPPSTLKSRSSNAGPSVDDDSVVMLLGCVQVGLGVLMAACGVLGLVHGAALANVGAGLWGGAVAMAAGVVGVLAGLRGCYATQGAREGASHVATTAFLALCLVALAVSNLVLVLAVTGLVRDAQRQPSQPILQQDGDESPDDTEIDWAPILANCGLLLVSALHCVTAVVSGYRCYWRVCPCASRHRATNSSSEDSLEGCGSFYSTSSKERLISNWLGQHPHPRFHGANVVLIAQPGMPGHMGPIFTLPSPPPPQPSVISYHLPSGRYINPMAQPRYIVRRPPSHLYSNTTRSKRRHEKEERRRRKSRESKQSRKMSVEERPVTEEEVAKTYTGLDREIAEEFIAIAMEPGVGRERQARTNSDITSTTDCSDK